MFILAVIAEVCRAPEAFIGLCLKRRELLGQIIWRNVVGRYKGAYLGRLWLVVQPLVMLGVYTFVFGWIFKARWPQENMTHRPYLFPFVLFTGLVAFNLFAEVLNKAPSVILAVPNYVKKIVFPLEVLPVALLGEALCNAVISLVILLVGMLLVWHAVPWTWLWLPVVWFPLLVFSLGWAWLLAALGVFVRDVAQSVSVLTTILLFATPIFYPPTAVPSSCHFLVALNPLASLIEQGRRVLIYGMQPDWVSWSYDSIVALAVFAGGWVFFQRMKDHFADVL